MKNPVSRSHRCLLLLSGAFFLVFALPGQGLLAQEFHPNAEVVVAQLNVRTKYPTLESRGFLIWDWDFGEVATQLEQGTSVQILETKEIADTHIWAFIRYAPDPDNTETGYAYVRRMDGPYVAIRQIDGVNESHFKGGAGAVPFARDLQFSLVGPAWAQTPQPDGQNPSHTDYPNVTPMNIIFIVIILAFLVGANIAVVYSPIQKGVVKAVICLPLSLCILVVGRFIEGETLMLFLNSENFRAFASALTTGTG